MRTTPTKWQELENLLDDNIAVLGTGFSARELAEYVGMPVEDASYLIAEYQFAQRLPRSKTAYVLHREGRAINARWMVGMRADDARKLSKQFASDTRRRFEIAVEPDLNRIGKANPQARKQAELLIHGIMDAALVSLDVVVGTAAETA